MCAAQEGHLDDALKFLKSAEEKVGRTAEVNKSFDRHQVN